LIAKICLNIIVVVFVAISDAAACESCFSSVRGDPMGVALQASMFTLLICISGVLVLFAKFFLGIRKRERSMLKGSQG